MSEEIKKENTLSEEQALLDRLKVYIAEKERKAELDDREVDTLRKMISIYQSFLAFGRLAGAARNIMLFVGGLLVAWFTFVDNIGVVWIKIAAIFGGGQ